MSVEKQINYFKNISVIIGFPLERNLIKPDCYLILYAKFKFFLAKENFEENVRECFLNYLFILRFFVIVVIMFN